MARVHDENMAMEVSSAAADTAKEMVGLHSAPTDTFVEDDRGGLWKTILTGADVAQDETEFGARCLKAPVAPVTTLNHVLLGYPGHCLRECRDGLPALACGTILIVALSMIQRHMVQEISLPSGTSIGRYFEAIAHSEGGFGWYVMNHCLVDGTIIIATWGSSTIVVHWYSCMNKFFWRASAIYVSLAVCNVVFFLIMVRASPLTAVRYLPVTQMLITNLAAGFYCVIILKVPRKIFAFRRKLFFGSLVFLAGVLLQVFLIVIRNSMQAADHVKLGLVLLPVLAFNLLIVPWARVLERSQIHCDPSTTSFMQATVSMYEKMFRRIMLSSMKDPTLVFGATLCSAILRILISLCLGEEDYRIYAYLGARMNIANPMQNVHLPAYGWTSVRNAAYQTNCFVLNSTMDNTLIVVLAVWRLAAGVADGEGVAVSYTGILQNTAMQLVCSLVMQAGFALYVTRFVKVDFISYARMKCEGWRALTCANFLSPFIGVFLWLMPSISCVSPSGSGPTVHYC